MTFVDEVDVEVRAGRGGDGPRDAHEPYKPKGDPRRRRLPRRRCGVPRDPEPARPRMVRGHHAPARRAGTPGSARRDGGTARISSLPCGRHGGLRRAGFDRRPGRRGAEAVVARGDAGRGTTLRVPEPRTQDRRAGERARAPPACGAADGGDLGLVDSRTREVDTAREADRRGPEYRGLSIHTLTPNLGSRSGRRSVRRRRHPGWSKAPTRARVGHGSSVTSHLPSARPRRRPLVPDAPST